MRVFLDKDNFLKVNLIDNDNILIVTEYISDREILQLVGNKWNGKSINVFLYGPQECFDREKVMREAHEGILGGYLHISSDLITTLNVMERVNDYMRF